MRFPVKGLAVTIALGGIIIVMTLAGLAVGRSDILDPAAVLDGLFNPQSDFAFAVREVRLPRILAAIIVGYALGTSGAIFQGVTRNGLVSPDIVGVNAGASFAALMVIVLATQAYASTAAVSLSMIGPAALVGAFGAATAVYFLGYRSGLSPYRLVLVGIGVTAVLGAGIAYALTLTRGGFDTQLAFRWMVGSTYGVDGTEATTALVAFLPLIAISLFVVRPLTVLAVGDDAASGLGAHVERDRLIMLIVGVCLAALAVALVGPVGFIAFIAPHIARALIGPGAGLLGLISAGLIGAALIVGADFVAGRVIEGKELPMGAVTTLIGAPYFLALLYRTNRSGYGA